MEDALLNQLKRSTLDEGEKDRLANEDISDISDEEGSTTMKEELDTVTPILRQGGRQTGPKGVIDDQKYQQQMETAKKQQKVASYNAKLLAKAPMTTTYLQDQQQQQQQQQQMELVLEAKSSRTQVQEEHDDDDEEVIKAYRAKRLAELKKMKNHNIRQEHRVFGHVQEVDADDYAIAIDKEWRTVPVIVHLYDDSLEHCRLLDSVLQGLAQKYCLAKIIRVSALDLEFDLVGSPAILGYKCGMLIANLVRLDDEVGCRYTAETVEDILIRHGVLTEDDQYDVPEKEVRDDDDDED